MLDSTGVFVVGAVFFVIIVVVCFMVLVWGNAKIRRMK